MSTTPAATANHSKVQSMAYIALFAVVMAVCSWISIPILEVPYTLQTFAVFLAVGVLGGKRGTLAVLVYILLGAVGVPVFAGFTGGLGYLLGNTGGYIIGFLFTALLMWLLEALLAGNSGSWACPWCWAWLSATPSALPGSWWCMPAMRARSAWAPLWAGA